MPGWGRLVLKARLPCSHLLECLVTCLGQITVQLLGAPLLLGPTDLSPLSLAGSSPFLFLLLKLSSLSFSLWDASHYLLGFSKVRKNHWLHPTSAFCMATIMNRESTNGLTTWFGEVIHTTINYPSTKEWICNLSLAVTSSVTFNK